MIILSDLLKMTIFLFHSVPLQYAFFCYHLDFSRQNLPQKWKPEEDCSEDLQSIALGLLIVRSWYSSVKSKCIQFALNINRVFATKFMLVFFWIYSSYGSLFWWNFNWYCCGPCFDDLMAFKWNRECPEGYLYCLVRIWKFNGTVCVNGLDLDVKRMLEAKFVILIEK